jgi:hypothetical protein
MLLKYSFVLRILIKATILMGVAYVVQLMLEKIMFFNQNWYWMALTAIGFALVEDKLAIERKHTLIYLPIKSDLSVFEWIENHGFNLMHKKRNRRIYVDRAQRWFERNEFVRITLMENKLKLKINNQMASRFERDFIAVIERHAA